MNTSSDNQLVHRTFPVLGMTCAACAVSLESYLGHLLGVESVVVSYPNESVFVRFDEALIEVKRLGEAAKEIGYELILDESAGVYNPCKLGTSFFKTINRMGIYNLII